ncbi:hypothetical protein [Flagellimonas meishanensis]|nr:hypothetical protein [[Muricauda] meishanensis]
MENSINCNCMDVFEVSDRKPRAMGSKIKNFLHCFTLEGAEYMSKTK